MTRLSTYMAALAAAAVLGAGATGCASRETPLSELTPATIYERGVAHYEARRWDEAIRHLDRFALVGGTDPRVNQARFMAADAYFQRREYVTAAGRFSALAGDVGRSELGARARFMACRAYHELSPPPQRDQEYTRAAIDHCQTLVDAFPDSEYSPRAREIVAEMWNRLAAKTFQSGEWYFRRRAWDSSLIYFEDVVQLYPATPYAPRALRRMMDVYQTLGYQEELEDTRRRLMRSYPESPEARAVAGG